MHKITNRVFFTRELTQFFQRQYTNYTFYLVWVVLFIGYIVCIKRIRKIQIYKYVINGHNTRLTFKSDLK